VDQRQLFFAYKVYLQEKALEFGMSMDEAYLISQIQTNAEILALIAFLVDCFGCSAEALHSWWRNQSSLYLAENELYNEWEM
jgi:hypothetical protein